MRHLCSLLGCLWVAAASPAATVYLSQNAVHDADGVPIEAVASSDYLLIGSTYSTVVAPAVFGGYHFTHWTNSSEPTTSYRDVWGRSQNPISLVLLAVTTATAHYLPAVRDSDRDGVPDWYEIEYFGALTRTGSFDGDADGINLAAEHAGGTHPLYRNASEDGGVAYADSGLVTVNFAGYASYTVRVDPEGTVQQQAIAPPGTVVTTSDFSSDASFGVWTLDGVRQQDGWGVARPQISFTMATTNREAVASLFAGDSDVDGLPDAYEQYFYATLGYEASSDTDGDGVTLAAEYTGGRHPLYADISVNGGVAYADSELVTLNFAGYASYTVRIDPEGTIDQQVFSPPGTVVATSDFSADTSFGYWSLDRVRQQDAWGVARPQISFTMGSTNREAVANLFVGDSDADGLPDAYEQYFYATLGYGAASDTDGDGLTLAAERSAGRHPLYADTALDGGVAYADSELVTLNFAGYARYTVRFDPEGAIQQQAFASPGAVVTTPDLSADASFGYWSLDGMRQQDAWGVARPQLSFTMATTNREAVASRFAGDSDADGLPDAYEQYFYATLGYGASSDTDGDGVTLEAERSAGRHPLYADTSVNGGVAYADSAMVEVTTNTVTLSAVANGSIIGLKAGGEYLTNTTVELTAVPAEGYVFTGWTGGASGVVNPLAVTVEVNRTIGATFVRQYTVTLSAATNGSITGLAAGGKYLTGTTAELTAVPAAGYVFTGWTGGASGLVNPLAMTVEADQTIGATFVRQYTVTLSAATNGSITGLAAGGKYLTGTTAELTAVPEAGYAFTGWTGGASGLSNPLAVTVEADQTIGATFTRQYTVTLSAAINGSITGLATGGKYLTGTTVELTAVPAAGYAFTGWTGSAAGTQNPLAVTVTQDQTIGATFTRQFTVTLSAATNGSITGLAEGGKYLTGTTAELTAVPAAGYVFTGWTGTASGTNNPLSLLINADKTIGAVFTRQYTMTLSEAINGSITGLAAGGKYLTGTTAKLTAVPAAGYGLSEWTGAASGRQNPLDVVMNADKTVGATFVREYTVTLSAATNGSITGLAAGGKYLTGTTAELTAVPAAGYVFTGWTGGASGVVNPLAVTVEADQTIGATFTREYTVTLSGAINGSITGLATGGKYLTGTTAELKAVPAAGYAFTGWTGGASGVVNPLAVTVTQDQTIGATFTRQFTVTLSAATNGTITGLVEGGKYLTGTTAELTAVPAAGYVFTGWTGTASGTNNPLSLLINADKTIGAVFTRQYTMTLSEAINGSITGLAAGGKYLTGTTAKLTAVPAAGYGLSEWTGAASGRQNPLDVVMNADKTVGATFMREYTVTLGSSVNGSITGLAAGGKYLTGTTAELTAVPAAGYVFTGWTGGASGVLNPLAVTVTQDQTIGATFTRQYTVTLSGATNGSITGLATGGKYLTGTTAELTAVPAAGYVFTGWTGGASGVLNPLAVTVTQDQTIGATFTRQYTVTLSAVTNGSITGLATGGKYLTGTTAELTAVPAAGYVFTGWTGGASGVVNPLAVTVTQDQTIGATFARQYTVTLTAVANGSITGLAAGGKYLTGTTAELTAVPAAGYVFTGWTGGASGVVNPLAVTVTQDQTIGATFARQYTVTLTAVANGSITGLAAGGKYLTGTTAELTAVPAAGYVFTGWTGGASGVVNPLAVTVTQDQTIGATFTRQYTVTLSAATNGSITGLATGGKYLTGTTAELTAVPAAGYAFTGWTGGANGVVNPLAVTVTQDQTIGATFVRQFSVTLSAATNGSITGLAAGGKYLTGTTAELTAVPAAGYVFTGWTGGASGVVNPLAVTVTQDQTIGATFTRQYTVTLSAVTNGSITGLATGGKYLTGTTAELTAVPAAGYAFTGWTGGANGVVNPLAVTVTQDQTIGATFVRQFSVTLSAATNGSITGLATSGKYLTGTTAELTAVPAAGYVFTGWTGGVSGAANPLRVAIESDLTVGADFTADGRDPDGDGLTTHEEIMEWGTDSAVSDTDDDGLSDGHEVMLGLDPVLADTDGDGSNDGAEVEFGGDALQSSELPIWRVDLEVSTQSEGGMQLRFPTLPGFVYIIEESTDCLEWRVVGDPLVGDGRVRSRNFDRGLGRHQFMRVKGL